MMGVFENKAGEANKKLVNNWRPTQALMGRTVYKNWDTSTGMNLSKRILKDPFLKKFLRVYKKMFYQGGRSKGGRTQ